MAQLDVSVGFGFALMGISYKSTQGGVGMHSLWESQHLGDELGLFSKANSSFVRTASIRTCWEHPQEGLNPWKTKDSL